MLITVKNEMNYSVESEPDEELASNVTSQLFEKWRDSDYVNSLGMKAKLDLDINVEGKPLENEIIELVQKIKYSDESLSILERELDFVFSEAFKSVFLIEYDEKVAWQKFLCNSACEHLIEYVDPNWNYAELMFAGYGDSDWHPTCYKIRIYDHDCIAPYLVIMSAKDQEQVWYQTLGQDAAVSKFWAPMDGYVKEELYDSLSERFQEVGTFDAIKSEIESVLNGHARDLLDPILEKVNNLSVKKLSFIAKQMVALESFRSFIHEYLPTVGGEIDCVTLTRDDSEASRV